MTASSGQSRLEALFKTDLSDAVVVSEGREGTYRFIETRDGARIRFDGRGYGLRSSEKYQTNLALVFGTEDVRY